MQSISYPPNLNELLQDIDKGNVQGACHLLKQDEILSSFLTYLENNREWAKKNIELLGKAVISLDLSSIKEEKASSIHNIFVKLYRHNNQDLLKPLYQNFTGALIQAIKNRDIPAMTILLNTCREEQKKSELSKLKMEGRNSLLMELIQANSIDLCIIFLKQCPEEWKEELYKPNSLGHTPLHYANENCGFEIYKTVLENCPANCLNTLFQPDSKGKTILTYAAFNIENGKKIIPLLLATAPNRELRNQLFHPSALHVAARTSVENVSILLRCCPPELIESLYNNTPTPLENAILAKKPEMLECLLGVYRDQIIKQIESDVSLVNKIVDLAIEKGSLELVHSLRQLFSSANIDPQVYEQLQLPLNYDLLTPLTPKEKVSRWLTNQELTSLMQKHPLQQGQRVWEHYVNRGIWDNDKAYNCKGNQKPYGMMMCRAVQAATDLAVEKQLDFVQLLEFCAYQRFQIAHYLNHEDISLFGFPRKSGDIAYTPLKNEYEPLGGFLQTIGASGIVKGKIHDEIIDLTHWNKTNIYHTASNLLPVISPYLGELYQQLLAEQDPKKAMELSGRLFWWICQAKPWSRGDPSIAEILIRTIWNLKGMENLAWKKGVIPWVEVTKEVSEEDFAQNFWSFFDPDFMEDSTENEESELLDLLVDLIQNGSEYDVEAHRLAEKCCHNDDAMLRQKAEKLQEALGRLS